MRQQVWWDARLKCSKRRKRAIKGVCFFDSTNCQGFSRRGLQDCSTWSQIYADTGPSPAPFPKLSQVFYKPGVEMKTHFWVQSRTAFRLRLPPQEPELGGTRETICAENTDKLPPHVLCLLSLMRFFSCNLPKIIIRKSSFSGTFVEKFLRAAKHLLYLFICWSGHKWGIRFIKV